MSTCFAAGNFFWYVIISVWDRKRKGFSMKSEKALLAFPLLFFLLSCNTAKSSITTMPQVIASYSSTPTRLEIKPTSTLTLIENELVVRTLDYENIYSSTPTLIYSIYPYPTPTVDIKITPEPTITPPLPVDLEKPLPNGLSIEEYKINRDEVYAIESPVSVRHRNKGGWYFWPKGGVIGNNLFRASNGITDDNSTMVIITYLNDQQQSVIDCGRSFEFGPLITAWTYHNQWIIQSYCHEKFDILWDGVSLNNSNGYQSSFGFQLMDGKPFYMFNRNNTVWLSYDGEEAKLDYDEVKLTYCCMSYHPPQHYEYLITFYATKGDQLYYVAIGLFDK